MAGYGYNQMGYGGGYNPGMRGGYGYNQMGYGGGYNPGMGGGYNPGMGGGYGYNPGMTNYNQPMGAGMQQMPPQGQGMNNPAMNPGPGMQPQRPPVPNLTVEPIEGVPAGLEVLHETEHVFVRQTFEFAEYLYNAPNKYEVLNSVGQRIYFAAETTGFWARNCCPNCAPFNMKVLNFTGHDVLHVDGTPGCGCCDSNVQISHAGELLGSVDERGTCCTPTFDVKNAAGATELVIRGPEAANCCGTCGVAHFEVFLPDMTTKIGQITKQWSGYIQEYFTQADNFGMSFPKDLDTKMKAVLLGATFLIDFRFFEQGKEGRGGGGGGQGGIACATTFGVIFLIAVIVLIVFFTTR